MTPTPQPVPQVLQEVLRDLRALPSVALPLSAAAGLVTAADILAPGDLPPVARSAMDGFAIHAGDVTDATPEDPVRLPLHGVSLAGGDDTRALPPGHARPIATGAAMPPNADAVVRIEEVRDGPEAVVVRAPVPSGRDVRRAGEDARRGDILLEAGHVLQAGAIAGLAGAGIEQVQVVPAPRAVIIPTGDEIVSGSTPDAVGPGLTHLLSRDGVLVRVTAPVRDDLDELLATVQREAAAADLVVTIGGASVGPRDHADGLVAKLAHGSVHALAIRPGRPFAWGRTGDGTPVLCLPGTPLAAMVTGVLLVRPVAARLAGRPAPASVQMALGSPVLGDPSRRRLVPATVDHSGRARPLDGQGAGDLAQLARTEVLLDIPAGTERIDGGQPVAAWLLG
jgi:molybdopterin molybdotransferase